MGRRILFLVTLCLCLSQNISGQFCYGTTGLLHLPTADMQPDKTFMAGASFLNVEATPGEWDYDTWNYYLNVTIFPWMEVGYVCTLFKIGIPEDGYSYKFRNQDRHFSVRLRLWKEGWWKSWTPQVVAGLDDPTTTLHTDKSVVEIPTIGNCFWNRYYLVMTKHLQWKSVADIGIHAAYLYNRREQFRYNGLGVGADMRFALPVTSPCHRVLNGLKLMAEYDSRTINIGGSYSLWKDHINLVAELYRCRYPSAGVYFKMGLK